MAVNVTPNVALSGEYTKVFDIEATADGDTVTGNIAHGLGAVPRSISIVGLTVAAQLSLWVATTIDATNIELTKDTAAGSGAVGNQVRLIVSLPHSITQ